MTKPKDIDIDWARETFYYEEGRVYYKVDAKRKPRGSLASDSRGDTYGYRRISWKKNCFKEHRIVWALFNDTIPDVIDHINGDVKDNRIENLRASNEQLNRYNTVKTKGLSFHKRQRRWFARIRYRGKLVHLGAYKDKELAQFVYEQAREKWIEPLYQKEDV